MTPKVSILVPIYNVAPFIERCAHSLFSQTMEDLEFIFVDDATPDNSIELLYNVIEQYPDRKFQTKILHHKKNKGLASSRNTAKDAAIGDYIINIDSDDYIEHNMIEILYKKAINNKSDIVICDYWIENNSNKTIIHENLSKNNSQYIADLLYDKTSSSIFSKLIKRSLYNNPECRVPDGLNYTEDYFVITRVFFFAKNIAYINIPLYHYSLLNKNSISRNKGIMHFENQKTYWELQDKFFKKYNLYDKYKDIINFQKVRGKVTQMMWTKDFKLLKKFAYLYHDIELSQLYKFSISQRIMIICAHYKLFFIMRIHYFYLCHIFPLKLKLLNK